MTPNSTPIFPGSLNQSDQNEEESFSRILSGNTPVLLVEEMPALESDTYFLKRAKGKTPQTEKLLNKLEERAEYDMENGCFVAKRKYYGKKLGEVLGSISAQGYLRIGIDRDKYPVQNLVWLWCTGSFANGIVDHIDRNKLNNKINNLRSVDRSLQSRNMPKRCDNRTGHTGIHDLRSYKAFSKANLKRPFWAKIMNETIGYYSSLEEAICARNEYIALHPELGFTETHGQ